MTRCDALVIGAGPAGATAATLLARRGWHVVLIEKAAFPRRKVCGEYISGAAWPLLQELGVASAVAQRAGPSVTRVGFYAANLMLSSPMPEPRDAFPVGRALGREHLDTLLLARAAECGAHVRQRCSVLSVRPSDGGHACRFENEGSEEVLIAGVVIAAHGAWESGGLPTQPQRASATDTDLLGFKAHFRGARLPPGLMPLLVFPDGYGGLVHTDAGRVSLSCCIRREALARARAGRPRLRAGDALLEHIVAANRGVREALDGAAPEGAWLSAGPIRPSIRAFRREGAFAVGNAAGEAHPIIAEGISMAIQSSFLLCERLVAAGPRAGEAALATAARDYERAWRRNFAPRVRAAALFAGLLLDPRASGIASELLRRLPAVLTAGARWSGKAQPFKRLAAIQARP